MTQPTLVSIHRYPIKSLAGQTLPATELHVGGGIPFDRCLALPNGSREIAPDGGWTPCGAFLRLSRNPELARFDIRIEEADAVTVRGPDGRTVTLASDGTADPAVDGVLTDWFGPPPGPAGQRVRARTGSGRFGYWDHEDGCLSLINLETLALLARAAGRPIDPARFRGNLYIAGLPALAELDLVGRRIRVGGAVLEFLRPIDRCRATSVEPGTGETGLNVPALLARTQGHMFCGVFARVVEGGRIAQGDALVDLGPAPFATRDGAAVETAPPVADWPRPARLVERVRESAGVTSFWFDDPLAGLRPAPRPGQHLRVHLRDADGACVWRAYTISGAEGSRLRISVKRDGKVSGLLHDTARPGDEVHISGPFGEIVLPSGAGEARPLALLSAGIGITPTLAMLRALQTGGDRRPVFVAHIARNAEDLALWPETRRLIDRLPGASARLHLSQGSSEECAAHGALPGRPVFDDLIRDGNLAGADVYLCGPAGFLDDLRTALIRADIDERRIHIERFASPGSVSARPAIGSAASTARPVHFRKSGIEVIWSPGTGSLLDLAEESGLSPPANCRSGACGTCRADILSGSVVHDPEIVLPVRTGSVLLCCAAPAEGSDPLVIEI